MTRKAWGLAAACLALAGCSGAPSLSTGSLFGGSSPPKPAPVPQVKNDPTSRAFQVGTTSARAQKCGFNFDPVKLKSQYLAYESTAVAPGDLPKVEQTYDVASRAVGKAVAGQSEDYCSQAKTADIKAALSRHLAGDYTPSPPKPQEGEDGGLFGDWSSDGNSTFSAQHPMDNS